ncbi:SCO family protein [Acidocella aminolytica]|uniref:Electron transport transmembrane protein Sco1/SenC/PrrC n=1 Tax=Acidocella aminolytica 101 = DSM 11237 TaxID=1120923 RepID=A0A0D6PKX2_9PROT|nr:SCO family protein [Acidocella aminolytica]GAN82046.1 electron transport transmembrane protein Sco1/SenC/PrrC [Acidocella aminolytica 101 = DSM 11237]GBQ42498.1 electron transport transmembrane protein SenC/PrrC [Acidocella aminolytica 101 = DSM 11237]SHF38975.1 protein SCO1/2 [Acidocella aminolytica 101 = DSM 11237]
MRIIRNLGIGICLALAVIISIVAIDPSLLKLGQGNLSAPLPGSESGGQMATTTNSGIPPGAPIGGPFQLTNQLGQPVSDATYRGKYMLVFFGYSHCPDECPLTLQKMALTMNALGPLAQHIAPIFITIDPTRDTPPALKPYLSKFGPDLMGLTGSNAQIAGVAHEYAVAFNTNNLEASGASVISHSTYIYLMGPDGKFLNLFPFTITVAQLTSVLKAQINP